MQNKSCLKYVLRNSASEEGRSHIKALFVKTLARRNYRNYSGIIDKLKAFAASGKKIVLHGAGWHTSQLLKSLAENDKMAIVAITDAGKVGIDLFGFSVIHPRDISFVKYDYVCLSTDIHQKSMKRELRDLNIPPEKIVDLYRPSNVEFQDFISGNVKTKILDTLNEINKCKEPCVIISNSMGLNHPRLIKYLARRYELFVLTSNDKIQSISIEEFRGLFRIAVLSSVSDLITIASKLDRGFLITINGIYWNSLGAAVTLASNRPSFAYFVDILSSAYGTQDKLDKVCDARNELFAEKVLWKYSSGVIFKESHELADSLVEKYKPKGVLQFLDYCDDEIEVEAKTIGSDDSLSFVYAGGLLSPKAGDPNCNHHLSICEVAKSIISHGNRFSIYNAYDEGLTDDWSHYKNIGLDGYKYMAAVPITILASKLSEYDVGVVIFNFAAEGVENSGYYKYGGFSKIMAYIEAELPIVISKETQFMSSMVEKYDIGVALSWDEVPRMREYLTAENLARWKKNIREVKRKLSYNENIGALVDFIEAHKN